ncbi:hypothetical protein [Carboxylicivirga sp. RSCT41]|uniref:hypothetical protein n=1 Tax=Carboxylicivirga agarovorans TaxID=3417570 RepID=UPI003D3426BC
MKYIEYRILPKFELIIEFYKGVIKLGDILNLKDDELVNIDYSARYNYIADFRLADLEIDINDVNEYVRFAENNQLVGHKKRVAFLTHTPKQAAFLTLYHHLSSSLPIETNVFTQLESAIDWVQLPISNLESIDLILKSMKDIKFKYQEPK